MIRTIANIQEYWDSSQKILRFQFEMPVEKRKLRVLRFQKRLTVRIGYDKQIRITSCRLENSSIDETTLNSPIGIQYALNLGLINISGMIGSEITRSALQQQVFQGKDREFIQIEINLDVLSIPKSRSIEGVIVCLRLELEAPRNKFDGKRIYIHIGYEEREKFISLAKRVIRLTDITQGIKRENSIFEEGFSTSIAQETSFIWTRPSVSPFESHEDFVGREDDIQQLKPLILGRHRRRKTLNRTIIIRGEPGVGKTYLAKQLGVEFDKEFPGGVIWTNLGADNRQSDEIIKEKLLSWAQFSSRTDQIRPSDIAPEILKACFIKDAPERLLVIFNDVFPSQESIVRRLFAALPDGTTRLITTQSAELAASLSGSKGYELHHLNMTDSLRLLHLRLREMSDDIEIEDAELRVLAVLLGHSALALHIVSKLIIRSISRNPVQETISRIRNRLESTQLLDYLRTGEAKSLSLTATFAECYENLGEPGDTRVRSQKRFRMLGVLNPGNLNSFNISYLWNEINADRAEEHLEELVNAGILQTGQIPNSFEIHRLLHQYALYRLQQEGEHETAFERYGEYFVELDSAMMATGNRDVIRWEISDLQRYFRQALKLNVVDIILELYKRYIYYFEMDSLIAEANFWTSEVKRISNQGQLHHPAIPYLLLNMAKENTFNEEVFKKYNESAFEMAQEFDDKTAQAEAKSQMAQHILHTKFDQFDDAITLLSEVAALYQADGNEMQVAYTAARIGEFLVSRLTLEDDKSVRERLASEAHSKLNESIDRINQLKLNRDLELKKRDFEVDYDAGVELGQAYRTMGRLFFEEGKPKEAEQMFVKGLQVNLPSKDWFVHSTILIDSSPALIVLGNLEQAVVNLVMATRFMKRRGFEDNLNLHKMHKIVYLLLGRETFINLWKAANGPEIVFLGGFEAQEQIVQRWERLGLLLEPISK